MKTSQRYGIFLICLAAILLLGILFRRFVMDMILMPAALAIWLLLRIFVLSIDQKIYWGILIVALVVFLVRRFSKPAPQASVSYVPYAANATLESINYWRTFIRLGPQEGGALKIVRRDLGRLLISLYESRQQGSAPFELYEALQQRKIEVPDPVYIFLFPDDPELKKFSMKQFLKTTLRAPAKWLRRLTGQEQADYYRAIGAVFSFLETSLETHYDDKTFD